MWTVTVNPTPCSSIHLFCTPPMLTHFLAPTPALTSHRVTPVRYPALCSTRRGPDSVVCSSHLGRVVAVVMSVTTRMTPSIAPGPACTVSAGASTCSFTAARPSAGAGDTPTAACIPKSSSTVVSWGNPWDPLSSRSPDRIPLPSPNGAPTSRHEKRPSAGRSVTCRDVSLLAKVKSS